MNKLTAALLLSISIGCSAQTNTDDTQADLRINPEIETSYSECVDYNLYPFVDHSANKIQMNGDDWTTLAARFNAAAAGDSLFSVVYLGDSHIQADFGGDVLRRRLFDASRAAGRGIVIPFKLAATNEPHDYTITLSSPYTSSRLLKKPWATAMPFTGIGISPADTTHTLTVSCTYPFNTARLLYRGAAPSTTTVCHPQPVDQTSISISSAEPYTLSGIVLMADTVGTVVHSIGNNGATYATYAEVEDFASQLAGLSPDLIIIALGTNEAFNKDSDDDMRAAIRSLIADIRLHNPDAKLMMVNPVECYKKVTHRRGRGRRRRTVTSKVVNPRIATMAAIVRDEAAAAGIPFYDHYAVASGRGAASRLTDAGILGKDGVHFTANGYKLWGSLLADALLEKLN